MKLLKSLAVVVLAVVAFVGYPWVRDLIRLK